LIFWNMGVIKGANIPDYLQTRPRILFKVKKQHF
jgi:hypothetical protein